MVVISWCLAFLNVRALTGINNLQLNRFSLCRTFPKISRRLLKVQEDNLIALLNKGLLLDLKSPKVAQSSLMSLKKRLILQRALLKSL